MVAENRKGSKASLAGELLALCKERSELHSVVGARGKPIRSLRNGTITKH